MIQPFWLLACWVVALLALLLAFSADFGLLAEAVADCSLAGAGARDGPLDGLVVSGRFVAAGVLLKNGVDAYDDLVIIFDEMAVKLVGGPGLDFAFVAEDLGCGRGGTVSGSRSRSARL